MTAENESGLGEGETNKLIRMVGLTRFLPVLKPLDSTDPGEIIFKGLSSGRGVLTFILQVCCKITWDGSKLLGR